jgi:hypothetical protein
MENQDAGGVVDQSASGGDQNSQDKVDYSTHRKLLAEKKKIQAEFLDLKNKFEEREQADLSAKGEIKSAYEKLLSQHKELQSARENDHKSFATKTLKSEFKAVASQLGARSEYLEDLFQIAKPYLSEIEFGEGYEVPQETLKASIAKLQKEKQIFFAKTAAPTKDVVFGHGGPAAKPIDQMSREELEAFAKQNFK